MVKTKKVTEDIKKKKPGKVETRELWEAMLENYALYSKKVNLDRAIPSLYDGLKPVHRKILLTIYEAGLRYNKVTKKHVKPVKTSSVVWTTMTKYYPHWDASIYWALVRLAQDFSFKIPLIVWKWNFWSLQLWWKDFAEMRYTECTWAEFTEDIFYQDLKYKPTFYWSNFDNTREELKVFPVRFPTILITNTMWIWIWTASHIPPHNIGEVSTAIIKMIESTDLNKFNPNKYILWPDFPLAGFWSITNTKEEIESIYKNWGNFTIEWEYNYKAKENVIEITSIPFWVVFINALEKIQNLVKDDKDKKLWIKEILDDTSNSKVSISIVLIKWVKPDNVIKALYKKEWILKNSVLYLPNVLSSQTSLDIKISLKAMLYLFIEFRKKVLINIYDSIIKDLQIELETKEAKVILIMNWREIGEIIEKNTTADAKIKLMKKYNVNEFKAEIFLETKMRHIQKLNKKILEDEIKQIKADIKLNESLKKDDKLKETIISEQKEIIKTWGKPYPRLTKLKYLEGK